MSGKRLYLLATALLFCIILSGCGREGDAMKKMNMLAAQQDWDALATISRRDYASNVFAANYYHLAQAYRGRLCEDLFKMVQHGPQGIIYMPSDHSAADPCLAHVLFAMGNMAAAQNVAFNSMFSPEGYDYAMMKIVAQVDLMRGCDEVASKYIDVLSVQKEYKVWAENAYADPNIERGRRDFPDEEAFVLDSPMEDILRILDSNPSDTLAMQYGLSFLLLAKDLAGIHRFVDKYYGSEGLRILPTPAQEALLFYSDYLQNVEGDDSVGRDYCLSHGVTESTIRRFEKFQNESLSGDGAPSSFRTTFWHYLLYEQI